MQIRAYLAAVIGALLLITGCVSGQVSQSAKSSNAKGDNIVVVAGATGGTGRALINNLQQQGYSVRAFVRDSDKARVVLGDDVELVEGDVRDIESIRPAMQGAVYAISAIGAGRKDPENGPEAVDFNGVKNLAEAAADARVQQFVLVSSSGVTHDDHFLNKVMDNVLKWKFKGEEALRASGVPYTIVRPGGLINTPGGNEELVFAQGDTTAGRISREDVALICVAALGDTAAVGKTFETYSTEQAGSNDWPAMFGALTAD